MELFQLQGEWHELFFQYKLPIILGAISLTCIGAAAFIFFQTTYTHEPVEIMLEESTASGQTQPQGMITVDVAGGVVHPGVYSIPHGSRMEEALQAAGGLSTEASEELVEKAINRAQKITDGIKIYIPKKEDESHGATSHNNENSRSVDRDTSYNILDNENGGLISINSSSQSELESLAGVGPITASKIIAGRPYTNIEELVIKKAIGQKLFEKIKSSLSL